MARRVWVVPPTWNDGVAPSHAPESGDKVPGKGRTGLRRLSIRRTRSHDKPGEPGEATSDDAINSA